MTTNIKPNRVLPLQINPEEIFTLTTECSYFNNQYEYDEHMRWRRELVKRGMLGRVYCRYGNVALRNNSVPYWNYDGLTMFYYNRFIDYTGATIFEGPPIGLSVSISSFYELETYNTPMSMGAAGISDISTTWRQAERLDRLYLQRNELTNAQQIGIVNGVEREILAGMCINNISSEMLILFNNNAAGANDSLAQGDLVSLGWTIINSTTMEKIISGIRVKITHR